MALKESLIENNSIRLNVEVINWQDAIKVGTDMLEKSGAVKPSYYQAIIESVEKHGPYICIAPDFAMPHARPEDGVNRTAFALVTFAEPVDIRGESVQLMVTLAGSSSDQHMQGLMEVTQVLDDDYSETGVDINKLLVCRTADDVYAVIDKALT